MAAPTLTRDRIASLAYQAGFRGQGLANIVAIAQAESGGDPQAYNPETAAGTARGMGSVGLTQIYQTAHPQYGRQDLEDPLTNLQAAYAVSNGGQNFTPWSTWNNGAAQRYLTDGTGGLTMGRNQAGGTDPQAIIDAAVGDNAGSTASAATESGTSARQSNPILDEVRQKKGPEATVGVIGAKTVKNSLSGMDEPNPYPTYRYQWSDGTYLDVAGDSTGGAVKGGTALAALRSPSTTASTAKQVGTNTRDAYITTVDKDGNATTIPNPNYQPPASTVTAGSTDPYIISRKADGSLVSERNPNYIPPTQVGGVPLDDAIKTATLLQEKLLMQIEQGRLTNETAAQIFTQQWSANVDGPLKLQEARLAEQVAAQTASRDAQDIAVRSLPYRVGPGFGADFAKGNATLSGGGGKITYNPDDFTYDMPNFTQIGQQAANQVTSQLGTSWADKIGAQLAAAQGQVGSFGQAHPADRALAAISPTAAANVGAPPPNVAAIPAMAAAVPYVAPGAAQPEASGAGVLPLIPRYGGPQ